MIDPGELVDAVVDKLRLIDALVREVGGNPDNIYAYHDSYPNRVSLAHAIHAMPVPGIMACWNGTGPSSQGAFDVWSHQVSVYLRVKPEDDREVRAGYYRLFRLIVKGVPSDGEQCMLYTAAHPLCQPMNVPTIQRQTDSEALDYFEIPLVFVEIGDE